MEVKGCDLIAKFRHSHSLAEIALTSIDFPKLLHSLVVEVQDAIHHSLPENLLRVVDGHRFRQLVGDGPETAAGSSS